MKFGFWGKMLPMKATEKKQTNVNVTPGFATRRLDSRMEKKWEKKLCHHWWVWGLEIHQRPPFKKDKKGHVFPKKRPTNSQFVSGLSGEFHICQAIYHQMKQFMWAYGVLPLPLPPAHLCAILAARRPAVLIPPLPKAVLGKKWRNKCMSSPNMLVIYMWFPMVESVKSSP